jgi:predicted DNA-binding transcriptional regulator YafY
MNAKLQRFKKIRSYLRKQPVAQSVTEIYQALFKIPGEDVSRKTIERDMDELVESQIVISIPGLPTRYQISDTDQIEISLTPDEIKQIIGLLGEHSDTSLKLKKILQNY